MTVQTIHEHDPRVPPIPRNQQCIGDALPARRRMQFLSEVAQAEEGQEINDVLHKWWIEAMAYVVDPDRGRTLATAPAERLLHTLDDVFGAAG